jgi:hypothetical protein
VATRSGTSTSSTSRLRTSITRAPRQRPADQRRLRARLNFYKTVPNKSYWVAFAKSVPFDRRVAGRSDLWSASTMNKAALERWCFGKTPMQTFLDAMPIAKEKTIAA